MNRTAPGALGTLAVVGLAVVFVAVPAAAADAALARGGDDDPVAVAALRRAVRAPARTSYTGTQFVATWHRGQTTTLVVELAHLPGRATSVTVTGGGPPLSLRAAGLPAPGAEPATPRALLALLNTYDVALGPAGEVAGRAVNTVVVRRHPGDGGSLAARFWVDAGSGLLLRRQVYDAAGNTIRASAFVSVQVGSSRRPRPERVTPAPPAGAPLDARALSGLRSAGWACPDRLPGGLALVDARRHDGSTGPVIQLGFSDGVSTLSVFEQRGALDPRRLRGFSARQEAGAVRYVAAGAPYRVVWAVGDRVYSVVADAPEETVADVLAALPWQAAPEPEGVWDRLRRGAHRMLTWANPFG